MSDSTGSQDRSLGQRLKHGTETKILIPAAAAIVTVAVKYLVKKLPTILEEKVLPKLQAGAGAATEQVSQKREQAGGQAEQTRDQASQAGEEATSAASAAGGDEDGSDSEISNGDREEERRQREERRRERKRAMQKSAA